MFATFSQMYQNNIYSPFFEMGFQIPLNSQRGLELLLNEANEHLPFVAQDNQS